MTRRTLPPIPPSASPAPRPNDMLDLGISLDEAHDHIGGKVQYISASGTIISYGEIVGVGAASVFVKYGQGIHKGDEVAEDPRRLRLLPEPVAELS